MAAIKQTYRAKLKVASAAVRRGQSYRWRDGVVAIETNAFNDSVICVVIASDKQLYEALLVLARSQYARRITRENPEARTFVFLPIAE